MCCGFKMSTVVEGKSARFFFGSSYHVKKLRETAVNGCARRLQIRVYALIDGARVT